MPADRTLSAADVYERRPVPRVEPFRVELSPDRDRVIVAAVGELDLTTADLLADHVRELKDVGFDHLVIDLDRVSFMDCTGLQVLIDADKRAREPGRRLEVRGARGQVMRLLELSGVVGRLDAAAPTPTSPVTAARP